MCVALLHRAQGGLICGRSVPACASVCAEREQWLVAAGGCQLKEDWTGLCAEQVDLAPEEDSVGGSQGHLPLGRGSMCSSASLHLLPPRSPTRSWYTMTCYDLNYDVCSTRNTRRGAVSGRPPGLPPLSPVRLAHNHSPPHPTAPPSNPSLDQTYPSDPTASCHQTPQTQAGASYRCRHYPLPPQVSAPSAQSRPRRG